MKKRNPFVVAILSIVTCGIYGFIWIYQTMKALDEEGRRAGRPADTFADLPFVVQFILLFFYVGGILFAYTSFKNANAIRARKGMPQLEQSTLIIWVLLWAFTGVIGGGAILQAEINNYAEV